MHFLAQVNGRRPEHWRQVWATDKIQAAAKLALEAGPGQHEVFVGVGGTRYPDGAPTVVQRYLCQVRD